MLTYQQETPASSNHRFQHTLFSRASVIRAVFTRTQGQSHTVMDLDHCGYGACACSSVPAIFVLSLSLAPEGGFFGSPLALLPPLMGREPPSMRGSTPSLSFFAPLPGREFFPLRGVTLCKKMPTFANSSPMSLAFFRESSSSLVKSSICLSWLSRSFDSSYSRFSTPSNLPVASASFFFAASRSAMALARSSWALPKSCSIATRAASSASATLAFASSISAFALSSIAALVTLAQNSVS
mmetsp:Transcript_122589/g.224765  ORF Transcript_122589/g.224765 Transcript_122589/m.224765 type:complete len:240 (+) Transcript_122589:24-743(+)